MITGPCPGSDPRLKKSLVKESNYILALIHKDGQAIANSKHHAKQSQKAYSIEEQSILKSIEDLQMGISRAIQKAVKAEGEVRRLNNLPPLPEPDHYEEAMMAQQLAPAEHYTQRRRCSTFANYISRLGADLSKREASFPTLASTCSGCRRSIIVRTKMLVMLIT